MSDIPEGWATTNFGSICGSGQYGWTTKAKAEGSIKYLRTTDITKGQINWQSVPYCSEVPPDFEKYEIQSGDILISRAGSVGFSALISNVPFPTVFASYLIRFVPLQRIEPIYIAYFLKSPEYWQQISQASSGIAIANVNAKKLAELQVPIAPLNEQKRIADKLDRLLARVEACRERCDRIPSILKRFRQSVLATAISGDLTEDWRERNTEVETASALLKRIRDANIQRREIKVGQGISDPFDIPSTWEWVRLFDICKSITDGDHQPPPKAEIGVPFLTISNISKGRLDFNQIRYVPENYYEKINETRKPHLGDILYTAVGATYGIPVLVNIEERFCFQRHIAILKPSHLINSKYLLYTLQSDFVYRQATDAVTGTAQPTVPLSGLRQIKIPLPPLEEQSDIAHQLEKLFTFADRLEARYRNARAQVARLTPASLDKAFQGELVLQDPNDEPASVLLEQIRESKVENPTSKVPRRTMSRSPKVSESLYERIYRQFRTKNFDADALPELVGWDVETNREELFQLLDQGVLIMSKKEGGNGYTLKCADNPTEGHL